MTTIEKMQGHMEKIYDRLDEKGYERVEVSGFLNIHGCDSFTISWTFRGPDGDTVYNYNRAEVTDPMAAVSDVLKQIDGMPTQVESKHRHRIHQLEEFRDELAADDRDELVVLIDAFFEPLRTNLLEHKPNAD